MNAAQQMVAKPVAQVGENFAFFLRNRADGSRWPVGTQLYADDDFNALLGACIAVEEAQRSGDYAKAFDMVRAAIAKATA